MYKVDYLYMPIRSSILMKAPKLLHKTGLNQNDENTDNNEFPSLP